MTDLDEKDDENENYEENVKKRKQEGDTTPKKKKKKRKAGDWLGHYMILGNPSLHLKRQQKHRERFCWSAQRTAMK